MSNGNWTAAAMAVTVAMAQAGCAPDPESADYDEAAPIEGLYELSSHDVQLGCEGEPTPVADLPTEDAPPTTPFFVLLAEPGDFGGTQLVALPCDEDETCDVENEFRKFYDLEGGWKFAIKSGTPDGDGNCDLETRVDTLETDNGGDDVVMELRVTAGSAEIPGGGTDCSEPVRDTEPDDLACIRVERIEATRIKE